MEIGRFAFLRSSLGDLWATYKTIIYHFGHFAFSSHPLWGLGITYDVHLGLIGKHVVDFLLVLIELFSLGVTAEELYGRISVENRRFHSNEGQLTQNFR